MRVRFVVFALLFAAGSATAAELGRAPYYTRPVTPAEDLAQLRSEIASGMADEVAWRQRVAIYTSIGELRDAEPMLPLLIEHWPDQPAFREAQMILLSGQGKFVEALAIGEAILQRFPDYPTIRANLARVQAAHDDLPSAINSMISAISIGPIRVDDWAFLLQLLAKADHDGQHTLRVLEQKIAEHPDMKGLRYLQVMMLTRFGQLAAARDLLRMHPEIATHPELQRFIADIDALNAATSSADAHR